MHVRVYLHTCTAISTKRSGTVKSYRFQSHSIFMKVTDLFIGLTNSIWIRFCRHLNKAYDRHNQINVHHVLP